MTDNQQRATEWLGYVIDVNTVEELATALDEAEARGRAERDERTGEVVAALVARAEVAEAAVRGLAAKVEAVAEKLERFGADRDRDNEDDDQTQAASAAAYLRAAAGIRAVLEGAT